jgi:hypothetical protein
MTHDEYGKRVMNEAVGAAFLPQRSINYRGILRDQDIRLRIDGVIGSMIAVEIESNGASKHGRGAILDLINSGYPAKLLIVIARPDWGGMEGNCK